MKYILTIISLCLSATVCTAEQKYHNSRWHFSFTVPDGWEITDEESKLREYTQDIKLRFEDAEIVAVCRKADSEELIVIQCSTIGDPTQGISAESWLEERLRSNEYRKASGQYLWDIQKGLSDKGYSERAKESKRIITYPLGVHTMCETIVVPHKNSGSRVISTVRVLGSNRVAIFNFDSHVRNSEEFLDQIKQAAESVSYDKNYGFGQAK
ncbi:MAG: hypothetical protein NTW55_02960 [Planctomycetota bacterium]|nr:hypothetical protein [Planctomycetota bacterium]